MGHEIEIVSVFRFYFQCNISGILGWKIRVLNLFRNYIRAESTRGKMTFWELMHLPSLLLLSHCLCYQQLSSVIYSILSWSTFWEIKRHLLPGRKVKTNLDSILKSRDVTLPTNVCLVKAMAFPVVMYGCESWTIKKAEHWRIYAFELWCWRRLLRVPWTARRSNQSILKEISPEYSLEGHAEAETPMLWPPDAKSWFIWRDPDAGKGWRWEEKGKTEDEVVGWHHQLSGHDFE